ncbi:MAG: hypothetical protein LBG30_00540 [Odoribacteraceae bacterium]|jgi:hypothetical protein|nr:hypothetical protein [Odoribacteraceae bacterium]
MKIEVLQGTEQRLYDIVAPLVMDPKVIRQNDGVAFKTTANHAWILAIDKNECVGFLPIQQKKTFAEVNNYHVRDRDKKILDRMLAQAELQMKKAGFETITVITQNTDYDVLVERKYTVEKTYIKYTRYTKKL